LPDRTNGPGKKTAIEVRVKGTGTDLSRKKKKIMGVIQLPQGKKETGNYLGR